MMHRVNSNTEWNLTMDIWLEEPVMVTVVNFMEHFSYFLWKEWLLCSTIMTKETATVKSFSSSSPVQMLSRAAKQEIWSKSVTIARSNFQQFSSPSSFKINGARNLVYSRSIVTTMANAAMIKVLAERKYNFCLLMSSTGRLNLSAPNSPVSHSNKSLFKNRQSRK
jgi:hypothetical protein